ncbi:DUF6011 domain-containing protein [Parafrankia sp. EUN1f]|uniref:DUF6011 domain-containing protein n=1 Tax=Parafrankia sp. EUN1f TaxID=102897 RepID=UPI0001C46CFE|nr:DUF6011 domain-containing protein [Parafrankia sp. EUN1f]EFC80173.1 hypothetical protein FrEUN1fDRAFT_6702 [Parafrankia sp. EUN1f]
MPTNTPSPTHTARCIRCNRTLRGAKSVAAGIGPTCAKKVAAETADYSPEQAAKAVRLVAAGEVVKAPSKAFHGLHLVRGTYYATTTDCSCEGAQAHMACYHTLAVRLTVAA